jgi:hypothetical protein
MNEYTNSRLVLLLLSTGRPDDGDLNSAEI